MQAFIWRRMSFEPERVSGLVYDQHIEACCTGARGWSVSKVDGMFVASYATPGPQAHPKVMGTGSTPVEALEDARKQLQRTLEVVRGEIQLRVDRRDALAAELGRLD